MGIKTAGAPELTSMDLHARKKAQKMPKEGRKLPSCLKMKDDDASKCAWQGEILSSRNKQKENCLRKKDRV